MKIERANFFLDTIPGRSVPDHAMQEQKKEQTSAAKKGGRQGSRGVRKR